MDSSALPQPSADALDASHRLVALIQAEVEAAGGWIGFDRYMQLALYQPGLGYYSGGSRKFGADGDFVTAPETSPLFGACLATQCAQWFESVPASVVEFGAGSGTMAAHLLNELQRLQVHPLGYDIIELSGELRERQRQTISMLAPASLARVRWLDRMPESLSGVVLGNELLDAMPVRLFQIREGEIFERGVALAADPGGPSTFCFQDRPAGRDFAALVAASLSRAGWPAQPAWPQRYGSELGQTAGAWVASVSQRLRNGVLLLLDYGFPAAEYYHPQRSQGTLMCHYRHRSHADPFFVPGLQDISAHVDFSAVADAAAAGGAELLGYTSQAHFLLNCGLLDKLAALPQTRGLDQARQSQAVQTLVSEAEMGELFKVLALGRVDAGASTGAAGGSRAAPVEQSVAASLGFMRGDRSQALGVD